MREKMKNMKSLIYILKGISGWKIKKNANRSPNKSITTIKSLLSFTSLKLLIKLRKRKRLPIKKMGNFSNQLWWVFPPFLRIVLNTSPYSIFRIMSKMTPKNFKIGGRVYNRRIVLIGWMMNLAHEWSLMIV